MCGKEGWRDVALSGCLNGRLSHNLVVGRESGKIGSESGLRSERTEAWWELMA
jgi:hypothetical protein